MWLKHDDVGGAELLKLYLELVSCLYQAYMDIKPFNDVLNLVDVFNFESKLLLLAIESSSRIHKFLES